MEKRNKAFKNIILVLSLLSYFYLVFWNINWLIYDMTYIKCIIFILLICLFLYSYGILKKDDKTYKSNVNIYLFLYFILLISVTLVIGRLKIEFYNWWYTGQYKPMYTILAQLKYGSNLLIFKNIMGNSIMFMPLAFLLMLKSEKYNNVFRQFIIVVPAIISIEVIQAFTHTGIFDIDDIILNYFFTIIFTFIITRFSLMTKIKNLFYTDYKISLNKKLILYYLSSGLLIIYVILIFEKVF